MLDASAVPMMCFAHESRNCIYEEAKVVADSEISTIARR